MRANRIAALLALSLVVTACGGEGDNDSSTGTRPASTASIEILEPEAGATVPGPDITFRVELEGGEIIPEASRDLQPDTGHVHLKLNGKLVSHTYGTEQLISDVEAGEYILEAEFVAADHGPFNPRVITQTTFTVT